MTKLQRVRKIYSILHKARDIIIPQKNAHFPIKYFINFLNAIPNDLYSDKPIFYYENNKWDSLGLLGERTHRSTIRTKYLQLCFKALGLGITRVLDQEVPMFAEQKTEKKRFLASLYYVMENLDVSKAKQILIKAQILSDEKIKS